jgi:hypothetical protein
VGTLEKRQEKKLESPVGNQLSFIEIYIMKKSILIFSLLGMLMITGCATRGRISLIDLDLRTPEQIVAYQNEADVIYAPDGCTSNTANNASVRVATTFPWDFIIKIVEVVKGRVRILSIEWKK